MTRKAFDRYNVLSDRDLFDSAEPQTTSRIPSVGKRRLA